MLKSITGLAALMLIPLISSAETTGTSEARIPSLDLPKLVIEADYQVPSLAGAGKSAAGISFANKISGDQYLGLRGLVPSGGADAGHTVELFWRRYFPTASNTRYFFEGALGDNSVRPQPSQQKRDATSIGLGLGLAQTISQSVRLGALMGVDFVDVDLNLPGAARLGGSFGETITPKIGILLGVNL